MSGILEFLSGTLSRADLVIDSALWFPWIPMWIGILQGTTFLLSVMEVRVFRRLVMRGLSIF